MHGGSNGAARLAADVARSPAGCSVERWECVRSSLYIYPSSSLDGAVAASYESQGFEIGIHLDTVSVRRHWVAAADGCCQGCTVSRTRDELRNFYSNGLAAFNASFPLLSRQVCPSRGQHALRRE